MGMKRLLTVVAAVLMTLALAACGSGDDVCVGEYEKYCPEDR